MTMTYELGDRVVYVSDNHGSSSNNPLVGSRYECEGTVCNVVGDEAIGIGVHWDNDTHNVYGREDLEFVNSERKCDPNFLFKQHKRKKGRH